MNALFDKKGITPLPKTHRDRRLILSQLEEQDSVIKRKNLRDRFMAREHILPERAFYDGDLLVEEMQAEFQKVKRLIKDIEKL